MQAAIPLNDRLAAQTKFALRRLASAVAVVLRTRSDPAAIMGPVRSSRSGLQHPNDGLNPLRLLGSPQTLHDSFRRLRGRGDCGNRRDVSFGTRPGNGADSLFAPA